MAGLSAAEFPFWEHRSFFGASRQTFTAGSERGGRVTANNSSSLYCNRYLGQDLGPVLSFEPVRTLHKTTSGNNRTHWIRLSNVSYTPRKGRRRELERQKEPKKTDEEPSPPKA